MPDDRGVPPKADWNKTHPRSAGGCMVLFGLPFALSGAYMVLVALRVAPPPGRVDAPLWVVFAAGVVFLVPGLAILVAGLRTIATSRLPVGQAPVALGAVLAVVLTCMAVAFGGVALFGDPRGFFGGGLTGTIAEKRFWFGLAALLIGAIALVFGTLTIAALSAGRRSKTDPTKGDA
jgi:hypothetical protein